MLFRSLVFLLLHLLVIGGVVAIASQSNDTEQMMAAVAEK
jgi:hypothetical protein